jgi:hypothetical protein
MISYKAIMSTMPQTCLDSAAAVESLCEKQAGAQMRSRVLLTKGIRSKKD